MVTDDATPAGDDAAGEDRVAAWLAAHPEGRAWQDREGRWRGAFPVDGRRAMQTAPCGTPEALAAALDQLPRDCAQARLVEAAFPGWLARRWPDGIWRAAQPLGDLAVPLSARASTPQGLQAAIREAIADAGAPEAAASTAGTQ